MMFVSLTMSAIIVTKLKKSTLMMTIQALVKQRTNQPISDANLKKLLAELQQRGQVTITEGKVAYKL